MLSQIPIEIQYIIFGNIDLKTSINVSRMNKFYFDLMQPVIFINHCVRYDERIKIYRIELITKISNIKELVNKDLMNLKNLEELNLNSNDKITDEGIKRMKNITNLNLCYNNKITDEGIKRMKKITNLNLCYNNKITDEGIKRMKKITNF